jgi:hypothetical protein
LPIQDVRPVAFQQAEIIPYDENAFDQMPHEKRKHRAAAAHALRSIKAIENGTTKSIDCILGNPWCRLDRLCKDCKKIAPAVLSVKKPHSASRPQTHNLATKASVNTFNPISICFKETRASKKSSDNNLPHMKFWIKAISSVNKCIKFYSDKVYHQLH